MAQNVVNTERESTLKQYYSKFLLEARNVSNSTVKHYLSSLKTISNILKDRGKIENNIYEVTNLKDLTDLREELFKDRDFIELDTTGHRMYSIGLNHYYNFATGDKWFAEKGDIKKLDIPLNPEEPSIIQQKVWPRSDILRIQVIKNAQHRCELNPNHRTFIAEKNGEMFMEGHHSIPMRKQSFFKNSLDIYANIICLCPICHRQIHYGRIADRIKMVDQIYNLRSERLKTSGIVLSRDEFISAAIGD